MSTPRIVGGSSYNNPYAQPASFDPFREKIFEAFQPAGRELSAQEIQDDPVTQIKAEFAEAQRRQREPKPREGVQL